MPSLRLEAIRERFNDHLRTTSEIRTLDALAYLAAFRRLYPTRAWEIHDVERASGWEFAGCGRNPGRMPIAAAWHDDETLRVLYPYGNVEDGVPGDVPISFWSRPRNPLWFRPEDQVWHAFIPCLFSEEPEVSQGECICARCGKRESVGWKGFRRVSPESALLCSIGASDVMEPLRVASTAKAPAGFGS
jgi:hypothetical protein